MAQAEQSTLRKLPGTGASTPSKEIKLRHMMTAFCFLLLGLPFAAEAMRLIAPRLDDDVHEAGRTPLQSLDDYEAPAVCRCVVCLLWTLGTLLSSRQVPCGHLGMALF